MANPDVRQYNLQEIQIEHFFLKEALHCLLHSIIFHRALGPVTPREASIPFLEFVYVRVDSPEIEGPLEARVDEFCAQVISKGFTNAQLLLEFQEVKEASFFRSAEAIPFEQWVLNFAVLPDAGGGAPGGNPRASLQPFRREKLHAQLRQCICHIVRAVVENLRLPPLSLTEKSACPYKWEVKFGSSGAGGKWRWWNILGTSAPFL